MENYDMENLKNRFHRRGILKRLFLAEYLLLVLSFFFISFSGDRKNTTLQFSSWHPTSCYKDLLFSIKRGNFNNGTNKYEWYIKFKNQYQFKVFFNYIATESTVNHAKPSIRIYLDPGKTKLVKVFLYEPDRAKIFVDQLKFGEEDDDPFAICDNI